MTEQTDAGGRYRLRRWDAESEEWVGGCSQPWDVKEYAIETANGKAKRDGERYRVVDRLFNTVYDTHYQVGGVPATAATAKAAAGQPSEITAAQFVSEGYAAKIAAGEEG